jgi:hypothetical protein
VIEFVGALVRALQILHTNVFDMKQLALVDHRFAKSMAVLILVFPAPYLHVKLHDEVKRILRNHHRVFFRAQCIFG